MNLRIFTFGIFVLIGFQTSAQQLNCDLFSGEQRSEKKREEIRREVSAKLDFTQQVLDFLGIETPKSDWTFTYSYGKNSFGSPRNLRVEVAGGDMLNMKVDQFDKNIETDIHLFKLGTKDDDLLTYGNRIGISIVGAKDLHSVMNDVSIQFYVHFGPKTRILSQSVSKDIFSAEIETTYSDIRVNQKIVMQKTNDQIAITISERQLGSFLETDLIPKVRMITIPVSPWKRSPVWGHWGHD